MPDTLIAVIIAGLRRGRRGKNPNSGNNGPTSRRGSPLIKSTYDTQNTVQRVPGHDDGEAGRESVDHDLFKDPRTR